MSSEEASVTNPDRAWPSLMGDAFGHHLWASLRLIDACLELSPEQLATVVPGTYGSILSTARHFVGGDAFYLAARPASIGFRFAQAIDHVTDHRSQICTGLTLLGIEPPGIEVWDYGLATGRSTESWPSP